MIENRVVLDQIVPEGTTSYLSAQLQDKDGNNINKSNIQACTLTLYAPEITGYPIINNKKQYDLMNSINTTGYLDHELVPDDNKCLRPGDRELHRAFIQWRFSINKYGSYEIDFYVGNLKVV